MRFMPAKAESKRLVEIKANQNRDCLLSGYAGKKSHQWPFDLIRAQIFSCMGANLLKIDTCLFLIDRRLKKFGSGLVIPEITANFLAGARIHEIVKFSLFQREVPR